MKFTLMSLEEWKEAYGEGLKAVLENLILKLGLNIKEKRERDFISFMHKVSQKGWLWKKYFLVFSSQ